MVVRNSNNSCRRHELGAVTRAVEWARMAERVQGCVVAGFVCLLVDPVWTFPYHRAAGLGPGLAPAQDSDSSSARGSTLVGQTTSVLLLQGQAARPRVARRSPEKDSTNKSASADIGALWSFRSQSSPGPQCRRVLSFWRRRRSAWNLAVGRTSPRECRARSAFGSYGKTASGSALIGPRGTRST